MNNFWEKLKKKGAPIYVLAPMAGVTDSPFRQLCKEFGADVAVSEMASVAALTHAPAKTLAMLKSVKSEKPYVVQLFGSSPEQFAKAVRKLSQDKKLKIDGFDINFGCPVPKVLKQGAGSALFKDVAKSREVIEAVLANTNLPVSVKTRAKVGSVSVIDWLKAMSDLPIAAIMIHGRTLAQGFAGEVDASIIKEARKYFKGIIIANGGVNDLASAEKLLKISKADGLGLGRGVYGRPWLFKELKQQKPINKNKKEIFKLMIKHAKLAKSYNNNFNEFKKHLLWYVSGLSDAKKIRQELIKINGFEELKKFKISK